MEAFGTPFHSFAGDGSPIGDPIGFAYAAKPDTTFKDSYCGFIHGVMSAVDQAYTYRRELTGGVLLEIVKNLCSLCEDTSHFEAHEPRLFGDDEHDQCLLALLQNALDLALAVDGVTA